MKFYDSYRDCMITVFVNGSTASVLLHTTKPASEDFNPYIKTRRKGKFKIQCAPSNSGNVGTNVENV